EGLSNVEDQSSSSVGEIGLRDGRGQASALEPGSALSGDFELLIDAQCGRRRIVLKGRIRPQSGCDLAGAAGLDTLRLRAQRRVLLPGERKRVRKRQGPDLFRPGGAGRTEQEQAGQRGPPDGTDTN